MKRMTAAMSILLTNGIPLLNNRVSSAHYKKDISKILCKLFNIKNLYLPGGVW